MIKGWDAGVATMKKGEKAMLICRSDYAYGDRGSPPKIGPGATLHFEVVPRDINSMPAPWRIMSSVLSLESDNFVDTMPCRHLR